MQIVNRDLKFSVHGLFGLSTSTILCVSLFLELQSIHIASIA